MARVQLNRDEAIGNLPRVCMCCGQPATGWKIKQMSWHPPWFFVFLLLALLPYILAVILLTKRSTLKAPFCSDHLSHWSKRDSIIVLSLCAVAASALMAAVMANIPELRSYLDVVCPFFVLLLLGWVILLFALQITSIRPTQITNRSISLTGVCDEFVAACMTIGITKRTRHFGWIAMTMMTTMIPMSATGTHSGARNQRSRGARFYSARITQ